MLPYLNSNDINTKNIYVSNVFQATGPNDVAG